MNRGIEPRLGYADRSGIRCVEMGEPCMRGRESIGELSTMFVPEMLFRFTHSNHIPAERGLLDYLSANHPWGPDDGLFFHPTNPRALFRECE